MRCFEKITDRRPSLQKPIFLVGCGKSGTTFLGLLLAVHPEVGPKLSYANKYQSIQHFLDAIISDDVFHIVANDMEEKRLWDNFLPINGVDLRIGKELILYNNPLTAKQERQLIRGLTSNFKEKRFFSKQPFNTFRVHVLKEIFPDCKLIAIHRDGRDVIASWGRKHDRWRKFGGYENAIRIFARKWDESVDHLEAYKDQLSILTLRYEDLISDMQGQLKRIFTHCELKYIPGIYDSIQPISRVGRWVQIIPAQYHRLANDLTTRNRHRLGYCSDEFRVGGNLSDKEVSSEDFRSFYSVAKKEIVPCPITDSKDFETITNLDRHNIGLSTAICRKSGLIMTNPRPINSWYERFYKRWFWSLYVGDKLENLDELYFFDNSDAKAEAIGQRILAEYASDKAEYLDIGCGLGGLLNYMIRMRPKWRVDGIDASEEAALFIREKFGIRITVTPLEQIVNTGKRYDVISLVHVLEHSLNPVKVLESVMTMLKDHGIVYVEVPDLFSDHWDGKDFLHVAHNFIFDRLTLLSAFRRAGLDLYKCQPGPVKQFWPWALGAFGRISQHGPIKACDVSVISEIELERRKEWLLKKIDAAVVNFDHSHQNSGMMNTLKSVLMLFSRARKMIYAIARL